MTSFPGFRLSILTFCHTPFQINASTFYFHNTFTLSKFVKLHLSLEVFLSSLLSHYIHISHAYLGLLPKDRIGLMPYTPTKITTISNAPSELISSSYCSCTQQSLHFIPLRLCSLYSYPPPQLSSLPFFNYTPSGK